MKVLLFIVTYKASYRIRKVINEIPLKFFEKYNYKILISDDCSNDNTKSHIYYVKKKYKRITINFNSKNIGYGANIKKCMSYAYRNKYDYAAMIHGDNQYSPKYLKEMLFLSLSEISGFLHFHLIFKSLSFHIKPVSLFSSL